MVKPPNADRPAAVTDRYLYWTKPPPESSARLAWWIRKIEGGWRPNRRIARYGYDDAAEWYGVWIWEYLNIISPALAEPKAISS